MRESDIDSSLSRPNVLSPVRRAGEGGRTRMSPAILAIKSDSMAPFGGGATCAQHCISKGERENTV